MEASKLEFGRDEAGIFTVPAHRLGDLQALAAKLSRRTKQVGHGEGLAIEVVDYGRVTRAVADDWGGTRRVWVPAVRVRILGEVPRVAGWTFVARVDHDSAAPVVCRAPGTESVALPEGLWVCRGDVCDHCEVRRRRNQTYVLVDDAGALKRVGRTCLKDFVRSEDVGAALAWYRLIAELDRVASEGGEGEGGARGFDESDTLQWLECVVAAIRHWGWTSAKVASERGTRSTREHAEGILIPPREQEDRESWLAKQPNDADKEEAAAVLAWARALVPTSDYERNLFGATAGESVPGKHLGIVASAVAGYRRANGQVAERKIRVPSKHFGAVGKRQDVTLVCTGTRFFDGTYGTTTMVLFVSAAGERSKWFASGARTEFVEGETYAGKATVKTHEVYEGAEITVLTRCKLEKAVDAAC